YLPPGNLGHHGEARGTEGLGIRGQRQGARCGDADARARKSAWANRHRDERELIETETRTFHRFADHRDEAFGVASLKALHHGAEFDDVFSAPLGDTHRAAVKARVEGQNVHGPQPYTQSPADSPSENEGRISDDLRHFIEAQTR